MPASKSSESPACGCTASDKRVVQPHKAALLNRLKRVEGQVRGVANMVDEDRYCVDILMQVNAIKSAMNAIALQLLEDHVNGCVKRDILAGQGDEVIQELMTLVRRLG